MVEYRKKSERAERAERESIEAESEGVELSKEETRATEAYATQINVTQTVSREQKETVNPTVNFDPIKINPTKVPDTRDPRDPRDPRGPYEDPREGPLGLDDLVGPSSGEYGDPRSTDVPDQVGMSYEVLGNTSITQEDGVTKVNTVGENNFYNTMSCPCSTYAIQDSNGNIGCEREYYGVKQYFSPARRTNHFLENKIPRVGDKWACKDKTCMQSGYVFEGYHIVSIEENNSGPSSSIVNSKRFTKNCYIPQALYLSNYNEYPLGEEYDPTSKRSSNSLIGTSEIPERVKKYFKEAPGRDDYPGGGIVTTLNGYDIYEPGTDLDFINIIKGDRRIYGEDKGFYLYELEIDMYEDKDVRKL